MSYLCANVENVYLILHDLIPNGEIIVDDMKLKNIFCLSKYHIKVVENMFPTMKNKINL